MNVKSVTLRFKVKIMFYFSSVSLLSPISYLKMTYIYSDLRRLFQLFVVVFERKYKEIPTDNEIIFLIFYLKLFTPLENMRTCETFDCLTVNRTKENPVLCAEPL